MKARYITPTTELFPAKSGATICSISVFKYDDPNSIDTIKDGKSGNKVVDDDGFAWNDAKGANFWDEDAEDLW